MNIFYDLVRANKEFLCALLRKLILLIKIQNLFKYRWINKTKILMAGMGGYIKQYDLFFKTYF